MTTEEGRWTIYACPRDDCSYFAPGPGFCIKHGAGQKAVRLESLDVAPQADYQESLEREEATDEASYFWKHQAEKARAERDSLAEALRDIARWLDAEHGSDYLPSRIERVRERALSVLQDREGS